MKFDHLKTESDTSVTLSLETMFGEYEVLYQHWIWDGIKAQSLIFDNNDISHVDLNRLIDEVRNSPLVNDATIEITSKVGQQYTFINFNFQVE